MRLLMLLAALALAAPAYAQTGPSATGAPVMIQALPPLAEALRDYLLGTDYPEAFGDTYYRVRIENLVIYDITGDGSPELIAHVFPYYRQSATILIYRLTQDGAIERVMEGLAPGPLVPVSGELIDSHVLRSGVDFSIGGQTDSAEEALDFARRGAAGFGGFVAYRGFFHADSRAGPTYFVDMTGAELPAGVNSCDGFEFSPVRQIETGFVSGASDRPLLAAWTGEEIYFYEISGVSAGGFLRKRVWVAPAPEAMQGVSRTPDGWMTLLGPDGAARAVALQCDGGRCQIAMGSD
ncbi:MAG: hypothetical protein KIS81_00560 [Maricaulaceae bacterium]|nr:hypothetical protein [Maricaulaceae bacterium]